MFKPLKTALFYICQQSYCSKIVICKMFQKLWKHNKRQAHAAGLSCFHVSLLWSVTFQGNILNKNLEMTTFTLSWISQEPEVAFSGEKILKQLIQFKNTMTKIDNSISIISFAISFPVCNMINGHAVWKENSTAFLNRKLHSWNVLIVSKCLISIFHLNCCSILHYFFLITMFSCQFCY